MLNVVEQLERLQRRIAPFPAGTECFSAGCVEVRKKVAGASA